MLAVLHTVLLHRSTGKFHYKKEGTYSIGTVGTQDVDCDFIDFAYVRVSSEELDRALRKAVGDTLPPPGAHWDTLVAKAAQIIVVLVLCVAVAFGVLFLGCNLLLQAESMAAPPARDHRPPHGDEGMTEGV
uniref:Autophagy-related protein 101 n=1 Tax=Coturnix japonica TaxID=93934 RepID=A0A8C2YFD2_COTJA